MHRQTNNALQSQSLPTQKSLRHAIAHIIRAVQLDRHLTDDDMADELGVSRQTVANARNEQTDLNAKTIACIGAKWGVERLDPYSALWGARNVPLETQDADAMPSLTGAVHRLAVAQSPSSHGGAAVTHTELLEMLPDLRDAQRAINALIVRAERVAA